MFAVSRVDTKKLNRFSQSFSESMGLLDDGSKSLLPGEGDHLADELPPTRDAAGGGPDEVVKVRQELARKQKEAPAEALANIKVVQRRNELVLRLDDNIVFDSGDDRVRDNAAKALRAVAALIKDRKVELRVEGHTDNVPVRNSRFRSNWELSTARATAVIAELAQTGLAPERLSAAGYGEFHPVGPNDTPEARAKNRRVDIVISAVRTVDAEGAPGQAAAAAERRPGAPPPDGATRPEAGHRAEPAAQPPPGGHGEGAAPHGNAAPTDPHGAPAAATGAAPAAPHGDAPAAAPHGAPAAGAHGEPGH
jgi:chemotaxis protein MotB